VQHFINTLTNSVHPEEAWKAVSKGEAVVDSPEEYVAILMNQSTKLINATIGESNLFERASNRRTVW
jgi:hypothetical protein